MPDILMQFMSTAHTRQSGTEAGRGSRRVFARLAQRSTCHGLGHALLPGLRENSELLLAIISRRIFRCVVICPKHTSDIERGELEVLDEEIPPAL